MSDLRKLESALGHRFSDPSLLELALVHRSSHAEGAGKDSRAKPAVAGGRISHARL